MHAGPGIASAVAPGRLRVTERGPARAAAAPGGGGPRKFRLVVVFRLVLPSLRVLQVVKFQVNHISNLNAGESDRTATISIR